MDFNGQDDLSPANILDNVCQSASSTFSFALLPHLNTWDHPMGRSFGQTTFMLKV